MPEVATVSGAWAMAKEVIVKYLLPLGTFFVGYGLSSAVNLGYFIDEGMKGQELVAQFWKEGYGRLIGGFAFTGIGLSLVMSGSEGLKGALKTGVGGFLAGAGVGELVEGASLLGVA